MTKEQFLRELEKKLPFADGELQLDTELAGTSNWDSICVLGFIATADKHFDAELDPEAVANATRVEQALALIDTVWD